MKGTLKTVLKAFGYASLASLFWFLTTSVKALVPGAALEAARSEVQVGYLMLLAGLCGGFGIYLGATGLELLSLVPAWRRLVALDRPKL